MSGRSLTQARWQVQPGHVGASSAWRHWLTDRMSLTAKLKQYCPEFRVQCLHQRQQLCLADEYAALGLARRLRVYERDVLLRCQEQAVVFAHTIVPLQASVADWPFFNTLGERSLGTTLFGDPQVQRGALHFARLPPQHPLVRRARLATGETLPASVFARRCLFKRRNGLLLVTELFLPAICTLRPSTARAAPSHHGWMHSSLNLQSQQ